MESLLPQARRIPCSVRRLESSSAPIRTRQSHRPPVAVGARPRSIDCRSSSGQGQPCCFGRLEELLVGVAGTKTVVNASDECVVSVLHCDILPDVQNRRGGGGWVPGPLSESFRPSQPDGPGGTPLHKSARVAQVGHYGR